MHRVSASEHDLLTVMRALVERPASAAVPGPATSLVRNGRVVPRALSPAALHLIRDTLQKGLVLALLGRGGARYSACVRDGDVVRGRLWQRHEPPPLHVSSFALHLCAWLVEQPMRETAVAPLEHAPATLADELILYLAMDLAHGARVSDALAAQRATRGSALCWLGFADVMARHLSSPADIPPPDVSVYAFAPWTSGPGAVIIEALAPDLGRRVVEMERDKLRLPAAALVLAGRVQEAVLGAFLAAIDGAGRRDLCGFVIDSAAALLAERGEARAWMPAPEPGTPLYVRSHARRAAVSLLRGLGTLERWAESARAVRFFDDDYDVAQLFLRLWQPLDGDARRAHAIVAAAESLRDLTA